MKREKVTPAPTVLTTEKHENVGPNSFSPTKVLKLSWDLMQLDIEFKVIPCNIIVTCNTKPLSLCSRIKAMY